RIRLPTGTGRRPPSLSSEWWQDSRPIRITSIHRCNHKRIQPRVYGPNGRERAIRANRVFRHGARLLTVADVGDVCILPEGIESDPGRSVARRNRLVWHRRELTAAANSVLGHRTGWGTVIECVVPP